MNTLVGIFVLVGTVIGCLIVGAWLLAIVMWLITFPLGLALVVGVIVGMTWSIIGPRTPSGR